MGKDKTGFVAAVLLVLLLGLGLFLYSSEPTEANLEDYQYSNGYTVFNVDVVSDIETYISMTVGIEEIPYVLGLRNDPASLEDIPVEGNWNTRIYNDDAVFITFHPYANLTGKTTVAVYEIAKVIDNEHLYDIPVLSAVTEEYEDHPVVRCEHGNDLNTVIYLTLGSETTVFAQDHCIYVVGTDEDELIRAADRFVLGLLDIMPVN